MQDVPKKKHGVFVGRVSPLHRGHERAIQEMLQDFGSDRSAIVIGSTNAPIAEKTPFTFDERKNFCEVVFPEIKVFGLPDFHNNTLWLAALDELLEEEGIDPANTLFYGGSPEDITFFEEAGRNVKIIDRHGGSSPSISATAIRSLLHKREYDRLDGLVDARIKEKIIELFEQRRHEIYGAN
ncbi:MAG: hypothetical protein HY457_03065 [Parcubacteria group bacterium]|nr:hypothetical protein [Parcubacteria group bacterium]